MSESKSKPTDEVKALEPVVVESKSKPTDEVTLVDKDGNESITTRLFYDKQKDSFDLAGLTIKK